MQLFYDPSITEGTHQLRDEEAAHAFRVLRKKVGDELNVVDGQGSWYRATVTSITKRECLLDALLLKHEAERASHHLTLMVAPTKSIDRFEWILEKATELGIDRIQPFYSEHSERKRLRTDRLERILESAMKQSLSAWKPVLSEPSTFTEAVSQVEKDGQRYLAYLGTGGSPLLHHTAAANGSVTVAIGPEGGFSPAEAERAKSNGFEFVSLGPKRLRTETAAIASVHTINQLNW
ncbi:16S rRNA (uracil(1498)-N(3))-methyltransferase [Lewinella sp. 4G2]|uniref:RsmE family RNA methyltransferase n=1 Tax=Lewinella sp. 4G2 TaxID=1803372 RepID=UPI0007B4D3CC|nr:RsmE family RNA methyltransferase [Lewinella sp. 4G2]OAV44893.1 16S rRNA (uracil(1498)-N(3))-methyltransferase [Lewinella sp. 4G2]